MTMLDRAILSVIAQGGRNPNLPSEDSCSYDYGNGNRCAVGWLLNDAQFKYAGEHCNSVDSGELLEKLRGADLLSRDDELMLNRSTLSTLQAAHDTSMPRDVRSFAANVLCRLGHTLKISEPVRRLLQFLTSVHYSMSDH